MAAVRVDTRTEATKAAETVLQVRGLALVNQRILASILPAILNQPSPNDVLRPSVTAPVLAARLQDESPEVRLLAIEAFEHLDSDARSELSAIIQASTNANVFVRWVATRTLGRMFVDASAAETDRLVNALKLYVPIPTWTCAAQHSTAPGRAGLRGQPATDVVLLLRPAAAIRNHCSSAIRTLGLIEADYARTIPVLKTLLRRTSSASKSGGGLSRLGRHQSAVLCCRNCGNGSMTPRKIFARKRASDPLD